MNIEDVIECLNTHIESRRKEQKINAGGHLLLQKTIIPNHIYNTYKDYNYTLWFVNKEVKKKIIILNRVSNTAVELKDGIINYMDKELIKLLFNWIESKEYIEVIRGEGNEYHTE